MRVGVDQPERPISQVANPTGTRPRIAPDVPAMNGVIAAKMQHNATNEIRRMLLIAVTLGRRFDPVTATR